MKNLTAYNSLKAFSLGLNQTKKPINNQIGNSPGGGGLLIILVEI